MASFDDRPSSYIPVAGASASGPRREQFAGQSVNPFRKKKIVVCCDGTWNNADLPSRNQTNVYRIARCVKAIDKEGCSQIVYYRSGVGTGNWRTGNMIEGGTGQGISRNAREAYSFICLNFCLKKEQEQVSGNNDPLVAPSTSLQDSDYDDIILVGFSRGAFTARIIAAFIHDAGILTKRGLGQLSSLFSAWKSRKRSDLRNPNSKRSIFFSDRLEEVSTSGFLLRGIRVRVCAVWDTVGALWFPMPKGVPQKFSKRYAFVNSKITPNIDHAIQALALNERRRDFQPIIWRKPTADCSTTLQQCWFLGCHSDVGGGNQYPGLSNIALAWMMVRLEPHLLLDMDVLDEYSHDLAREQSRSITSSISISYFLAGYEASFLQNVTEYHAKAQESLKSFFLIGGALERRPGRFFWNEKGRYPNTSGPRVRENLHFTVRALVGKGYHPIFPAIRNAVPRIITSQIPESPARVQWQFPGDDDGCIILTLDEDTASQREQDILVKLASHQLQTDNIFSSKFSLISDVLLEAGNPETTWQKNIKILNPSRISTTHIRYSFMNNFMKLSVERQMTRVGADADCLMRASWGIRIPFVKTLRLVEFEQYISSKGGAKQRHATAHFPGVEWLRSRAKRRRQAGSEEQ